MTDHLPDTHQSVPATGPLALKSNDGLGAWVPVAERLPDGGKTVLAVYRNGAGRVRRIRAVWVAAKTCEASPESEIGEYDEASDTYYDPEGWYEKIDNWYEYTAVEVHQGTVTHWMPLPAPPQSA